jgi:hypothetical protein
VWRPGSARIWKITVAGAAMRLETRTATCLPPFVQSHPASGSTDAGGWPFLSPGTRLTDRRVGWLLAGGERAGKCPGGGGNIRSRRRAELVAPGFNPYGWRCACCGSGTWRRLSTAREAARPRCRDVWHVLLTGGEWLPRRDSRSSVLQWFQGHGRDGARPSMAATRSAAMPVTRSSCWSSALTEPPVTGTLAPQGARRRSQSNEEDR